MEVETPQKNPNTMIRVGWRPDHGGHVCLTITESAVQVEAILPHEDATQVGEMILSAATAARKAQK